MSSKKSPKEFSIRDKIRQNNTRTMSIIAIIVFFTLLNLALIDWYQFRENKFTEREKAISDVIIGQYEWLKQLNIAINTSSEFNLVRDPESCTFGLWYNSVKDSIPQEISSAFQQADEIHRTLHEQADMALRMKEGDQTSAKVLFFGDITKNYNEIIENLQTIITYYSEKAEKAHNNLIARLIWAIMTDVVLAFVAAFVARKLGNSLAKNISEPISAVATWSKELSKGSDDLSFEALDTKNLLSEIRIMAESFQEMAASIQENVRVVQNVADGDMTAFVNIRSSSDSLGKNLYRMVQSNDLMFAEISDIAENVANGAKEISRASSDLAESSNLQAAAVTNFKATIEETSRFITSNNEKSQASLAVSDQIKEQIVDSNDKMEHLLLAMGDIREASEKVSAIIKTINDIAEQTNLLALNASIEAARAGDAGKGFAVVANEVKDLAAKSSEAVEESKKLIEDTIKKTSLGDSISKETSQTFTEISDNIIRIANMTEEISRDGQEQQEHIITVESMIQEIAHAVESNAASSKETSAASEELDKSANALKESMNRFHLRKRTPGKPYIPPEKKNDPEFIRIAEENYKKALQEGRLKK